MKTLLHLLLPVIWIFMLLELAYKKILLIVYWFMGIDDDTGTQRERKEKNDETRPGTTDEQRKIEPPDRNQQDDDGMNPQERTLPRFVFEKTKPKPKKEEQKPEIVFEFPKKNRKGQSMEL